MAAIQNTPKTGPGLKYSIYAAKGTHFGFSEIDLSKQANKAPKALRIVINKKAARSKIKKQTP